MFSPFFENHPDMFMGHLPAQYKSVTKRARVMARKVNVDQTQNSIITSRPYPL